MTTLTSDQLTHIRNNTGASASELSDVYLQYIHDNDGEDNINKTILYALYALRAIVANKVNKSNARTGDSKQNGARFDNIRSLIRDWEFRVGTTPSVTAGTINLGIDEEDSELNIT